jgi:hypothetical protein
MTQAGSSCLVFSRMHRGPTRLAAYHARALHVGCPGIKHLFLDHKCLGPGGARHLLSLPPRLESLSLLCCLGLHAMAQVIQVRLVYG